jgi:hypothetical protein
MNSSNPVHLQVNDRFKLDWGTYLTTSEQIIYGLIDGRGSGFKVSGLLNNNNIHCRLLICAQFFIRSTLKMYSTVWIFLSFNILSFHIVIFLYLALTFSWHGPILSLACYRRQSVVVSITFFVFQTKKITMGNEGIFFPCECTLLAWYVIWL